MIGDVIASAVWLGLLLTGRAVWREHKREDGLGWKGPGW